MFESLQEKLQNNFTKLTGQNTLTEENIKAALKDVKLALLEADVNFRVVNLFLRKIKEKAVGEKILKSLNPAQQFVKLVNEQLTELMGSENKALANSSGLTQIMMVGLQGSGKTTSSAKLANLLKNQGQRPYLVSGDVYRPAAIEQLAVLAEKLEVPCFPTSPDKKVKTTVREARKDAEARNCTHLIVDTAGRLQIDEAMMDELEGLKADSKYEEILLVVDAMTGQEAINIARKFNDELDLTGFILTKVDGDARGGAALSIRAVTQKPIKFLGVGEKTEELEAFHPERLASKILGMGDMLSLIEKAEQALGEEDVEGLEERIAQNKMNLMDFELQLKSVKKMGSLGELMKMVPGMNKQMTQNVDLSAGENNMKKFGAILCSMSKKEKLNPHCLNLSRKNRVARGSGTSINDVNQMIKEFSKMKKMMRQFGQMKGGGATAKGMKGMKLTDDMKNLFR